MTKKPQDSTDDVFAMHVKAVDIDSMREQARLEAARIWGVPSSRVKVQLSSIHVATRDPFPTDLSTYAAVDMLGSHARCIRVKEGESRDSSDDEYL
jgi:hypothetical protein